MVHIVGAGPGNPEYITVKGMRLLQKADVVVYTGSLVNPALLYLCKHGAELHNSAELDFKEIMDIIKQANVAGKTIVRLHTGDPSIYGTIQEEMDAFQEAGIPFDIIPGVSACFAAAASLKMEFTMPGVTQSMIITRVSGRTSVPEAESIKSFSQHHATMCIYLSVQYLQEVVKELKEGGYSADTPIAVVYRASWGDEKIVRGTLENIVEQVHEQDIRRQAMIIVSPCIDVTAEHSKLYDPEFSTMFRQAKGTASSEKSRQDPL